jgi:parallel beta-helix repeat protein
MLQKGVTCGIILLFIAASILQAPAKAVEKPSHLSSRGTWLYVGGSGPGNYTKIQDAIDDAQSGDTVYVYDDSSPYIEYIVIKKGISLLGENEATTVIESFGWEVIMTIAADNVKVSGFTIRDGEYLEITSSDHVEIALNNITATQDGVIVTSSSNVSIHNNVFYKNMHHALWLINSRDITVRDNRFYPDIDRAEKSGPNYDIMTFSGCTNCSILGNSFTSNPFWNSLDCWASSDCLIANNSFGMEQEWYGYDITVWYGSTRNIICSNSMTNGISVDNSKDNIIKNNQYLDISLESSSTGNVITENLIESCSLRASDNNSIYHNNFIDPTTSDDGHNYWDHGYPSGGNYWSTYHGADNKSGVNQDELGADGIGDTQYLYDRYPLMLPYGRTNLTVHFGVSPLKTFILIKNTGSTTALNVQWVLTLKGGILFCKRTYTGIVKPVLPGKETTVTPGIFLSGFGHIQLTLSAWADNAPIVTGKTSGILLLFLFFIR